MAKIVSPTEAAAQAAAGKALIVDVREPVEHAAESLAGSKLAPLSRLDAEAAGLERGRCLLLLCARGARAEQAAAKLAAMGLTDVAVVEGGLEGWRAAGLPIVAGKSRVWALERQVRFTAGSLVLAGAGLGYFAHPGFYGLSAFVGAGLVFSALTNTCGMAMVLARMPWNAAPDHC